jgi:hypothetical protein
MGRGALRVTVDAHGTQIDLISCHLKSKLLQFPGGFQPADEGERARFGAYALYCRRRARHPARRRPRSGRRGPRATVPRRGATSSPSAKRSTGSAHRASSEFGFG